MVGGVSGTVVVLGACICLALCCNKKGSKYSRDSNVIPVDSLSLAQVTVEDFESLCDAMHEDNVVGPTGFCALVSRCG